MILAGVFLRPDHSFEDWSYFHTAASETVNPYPSTVLPRHVDSFMCKDQQYKLHPKKNNKKKTPRQSLFLGGEADILK